MSMLSIILVSFLGLIIILLSYALHNLYRKNVIAEELIINYIKYLDRISRVIVASDEKLKKLDHSEMFKSDDEIGFFFESVKKIQDILNDFQIKKVDKVLDGSHNKKTQE